jgi:uncharacterized protein DUF6285
MQDRPTVLELLDAVRAFLEDEAMPALDPRRRFHARVAANVLGIVARELGGEAEQLAAEWTRLATLLGHDAGAPPGSPATLRSAVRAWTEELAARIRRGDADAGPFAAAVRAHVRETVREKLRVANPRALG